MVTGSEKQIKWYEEILIVRNQYGQKVKDSIHKNRACALAAWRRMCD